MSNLSGLPPTYAARALQAATQDVLVRIVQLPETLENNPSPVKLAGTVLGQNPDGSVKLQTDQGVVSLMLKDRGKLPDGMKVEIEIPAGRPPQQANIRSAPAEIIQPQQPSLTRTALQQSQSAPVNSAMQTSATASELKLDRNASIRPDELNDLLSAVKSELQTGAKPTTLNLGETIRLLSMPQAAPSGLSSTLANTETELIGILLQFISDTPDDVLAQKLLGNLRQLPFLTSDQSQSAVGQKIFAQFQQLNEKFGIPTILPTTSSVGDSDPTPILPRQFDGRLISMAPLTTTQTTTTLTTSSSTMTTPLFMGQVDMDGAPQQNGAMPIIRFFAPNGVIQTYSIPFPATNLSHGKIVMFQNISDVEQMIATTPQTLATFMKAGVWDSLQDLIHHASVLNPAGAQQIIQNLPSLQNTNNAGALGMLFLSMLKNNQIEEWIPAQMVNIMRDQGRTNILKSLQTDQAMMTRLENTALPNEWRANIFPFWHDGQAHKLPVYFKSWDDKDAQDAEKRRKKMRFLFDLNLSRMGAVQVDGFFQGEQDTPQLDMILRAEHKLSQPMQQKMKAVYTKAMERSHLNGELTFQFRTDQWVDCDEILVGV